MTIREVSPPEGVEVSEDGASVREVYAQTGPGVVSVDVASSERGPGGGSGFVLETVHPDDEEERGDEPADDRGYQRRK